MSFVNIMGITSIFELGLATNTLHVLKISIDKNIELCSWNYSHIDSLLQQANSKDITKYLGDLFPHPYTIDDANAWIKYNLELEDDINFAIMYNDKCIGSFGIIESKDIYAKNIEIGYWIGKEYHNKGIITKTVNKMVNYCFNTLDINRIEAKVFANNYASQNILTKCNFTLEATLKEAVYKNEEFLDLYLYRILKSEKK